MARRPAQRESGCLRAAVLRETLHLTNGNLNRHLKVLVDAGLLESIREEGKGRTRTWVTITPAGRAALDAEIAALRALIGARLGLDGDSPGVGDCRSAQPARDRAITRR